MFEETIVDQNKHWSGLFFPDGVPRSALAKLREYLKLPHILSLVGVRRCGKSTLAHQVINRLIREDQITPRNILFLNLEMPKFSGIRHDPVALERIYEDYLKLATPRGLVYCFLDEVQFFPDWQVFVKSRYERQDVKFIITGSNSRLLSSEFISLLSGRTLPLEVYPFSFAEFLQAHEVSLNDAIAIAAERHRIRQLFDIYLRYGGFPEPVLLEKENLKRELLLMYASSILYQDIAPRFAVKKPEGMERLFYYLMSNIATKVTWNSLAKVVGLSDKTVKEYLSYFADACLLFAVDAYEFSVKKQINSPKKIYAIDPGMAEASGFRFSGNEGHLLENIVYLALKRLGKSISYYATANGLEIDFAIHSAGRITGLYQVTWEMGGEKTRTREIRALLKGMLETGLDQGMIISYETEELIEEDGKIIQVVPAYKFLLDLLA
jgi:predicted AAA+ superfamily ATPase